MININFEVVPYDTQKFFNPSTVYLLKDSWNDYLFTTLFGIVYLDENLDAHELGSVKIAFYGQKEKEPTLPVGQNFRYLEDKYFSLGVSEEYYKNLNQLGQDHRTEILKSLNDIAAHPGIFDKVINEPVAKTSLFRGVNPLTVTGRFRRLAGGDSSLKKYGFNFVVPAKKNKTSGLNLVFEVDPLSFPPTNIHTIIGSNGVGKTFILENMIDSLIAEKHSETNSYFTSTEQTGDPKFPNLVSISFSAFDEYEPLPEKKDNTEGIRYTYIGLKRNGSSSKQKGPKSTTQLKNEFYKSLLFCQKSRKIQWKRGIQLLETDSNFKEVDIGKLIDIQDEKELQTAAFSTFKNLSSGHKIILLTITRLIEVLQEKSLVLIDEPEAHLHPPLLSAFIRAISEMLILSNGIAIISTHSPVILQEVPRSCVWKLRKVGIESVTERPSIETFGENVGILTNEVFKLEVTQSGFYTLINQVVRDHATYTDAVNYFGGELGQEARALIMAYYARTKN